MTNKEGCQGYILEGTLGKSRQIVLYCPLASKCPAGIGGETTRRVFATAIPSVFDQVKAGYRNDFKKACPKGTPFE